MKIIRTKSAVVTWLLALAATALVPTWLTAQEPRARSLTLRDAITSALEKNDGIVIERLSFDSADTAITGAKGAYDPLLTLDAGWRSVTAPVNSAFAGAPAGELAPEEETTGAGASLHQLLPTGGLVSVRTGTTRATTDGTFALLSPAYESKLGVELRQPLLRDRGIDPARLTLQVTAADRARAAGSLRRELSDTVAAVERVYWILVATRRAIAVQEEAVALAQRQLDETQARIEGGAAPETEIAQPRAELERRRGDFLATLEAASRAETTLKRLILGDDTDAWAERLEPTEPVTIDAAPVDLAVAMERALAGRPELEVVEGGVERRRAESEFASDRVLPALDLVVSYDRFGLAGSPNPSGSGIPGAPGDVPPGLEGDLSDSLGQLGDGDFDDARIGLQFSVPIRNRSARSEAQIAKNELTRAEAELARLRKTIRAEVLDAAAAADTASGRIEATRAAREAAEVQLESETERFLAGLSTNFLVLTRQNDLAAARLAEIRALTDYLTARTELARVSGSLLAERGIDIE